MRAGPRGIASQFGCASATAGEATSKTATRLAVQTLAVRGLILPQARPHGHAIGFVITIPAHVRVDHAFDHLAVAAPTFVQASPVAYPR